MLYQTNIIYFHKAITSTQTHTQAHNHTQKSKLQLYYQIHTPRQNVI